MLNPMVLVRLKRKNPFQIKDLERVKD